MTIRSLSSLQTLLANNSSRSVLPQTIRDVLDSVDPENHKTYGTWASRPTTPRKGDIYFSSDSLFLSICSANNTWKTYGPIYPLIRPNLTGFSWINQGNATLTLNNNYVKLTTAGNASLSMQQYVKTFNSYLVMGFKYLVQPTCSAGLIIRESSSNKLYSFHVFWDGTTLACDISRYTNNTTYLNNAATQQAVPSRQMVFLKYREDSTTRYFSYSYDLFNWIDIFSESKTATLVANQIGIFIQNQASASSSLFVYHLDYD